MTDSAPSYPTENVSIDDLRPHPRNYRKHPADQIAHLVASIREHGFYRNVVIAEDGTILAGHGVVEAARAAGLDTIPAIRVAVAADDPRALKILAGDNELGHLAEIDDRALSAILGELQSLDDLLGTGYDEPMLANLVFVTRPAEEIGSRDHAAHWVGLPEFDEGGADDASFKIVVHCANDADREKVLELLDVGMIQKKTRGTWSINWPERPKEDLSSIRFE